MLIDTGKQLEITDFIELMRSLTAQHFQLVVDQINHVIRSKQEENNDVANDYDFTVQDLLNVVDNTEDAHVS